VLAGIFEMAQRAWDGSCLMDMARTRYLGALLDKMTELKLAFGKWRAPLASAVDVISEADDWDAGLSSSPRMFRKQTSPGSALVSAHQAWPQMPNCFITRAATSARSCRISSSWA
jgi:hypothetical protein